MNEDMVIVCVGGSVLLLILLAILFIIHNKPFTYKKRITENKTTLTIVANKNLHKVTVLARFGGEAITFERKRIRKKQTVDFSYPHSEKPAKIIIEVEAGKQKVYEV